MWNKIVDQLESSASAKGKRIFVRLDPRLELLPAPIARFDDPFFPFGKAVISATKHVASGYIFDIASYLTMGAAGIVALERTIRFVPADCISILQGPFATAHFAGLLEPTSLGVSAITTTHTIGQFSQFVESNDAFSLDDVPMGSGIYWVGASMTGVRDSKGLAYAYRVAGQDVIYAGKLDDFAEKIKEKIEAF